MKKVISLVLAILMTATVALSFISCSESQESDLSYVQKKGKLVVGITDYQPMDYQDSNGKWIGFDAELATAFAKSLGVDVEFSVIADWDEKAMELSSKNIDCVWNGMTLDDEVKAAMDCSVPYCTNTQVVIIAADKADQYQTLEACGKLKFAVEKGSAGMKTAKANGWSYTEVGDQATALMEVAAGTSDAAIIDLLMAGAMVGEGTSYSNLTYTIAVSEEEQFGVGFRKGSDLVAKLNEFLAQSLKSGEMERIAKVYGTQEAIIKN